jgi:hypothetical protein
MLLQGAMVDIRVVTLLDSRDLHIANERKFSQEDNKRPKIRELSKGTISRYK